MARAPSIRSICPPRPFMYPGMFQKAAMPFLEAMPVTASSRRIAEIRRLGQHLGQPGLPRFDSAPTVRPFLNDQSAAQRYSAFDKCHADPDGARIRIRRILDQVLPAQFLKKRFPRNGLCCLDSGCSVWRTVVSSERSSVSGKGIFVVRRGQPTSLRLPSVRPSAVGGARRALPNRFLPV